MSFAAFRTSARKAWAPAPVAARTRVALRSNAFRRFATESAPPPQAPKSNNNLLYVGIGAAAIGGVTWYIFSDSDAAKVAGTAVKSGAQAAKVAANFTPSKEDYLKVGIRNHRPNCYY